MKKIIKILFKIFNNPNVQIIKFDILEKKYKKFANSKKLKIFFLFGRYSMPNTLFNYLKKYGLINVKNFK
jgi:hypothetical protein